MKIAGLDVGTTACKICIYEENGEFVNTFEREYPRQQSTQVDINMLWQSVAECLKDAACYPDLAAIGVTSFGETCVLLDKDDQPLLDALLYIDPRGNDEAEELAAHFGEKRIFEVTGVIPSGMFTLPKLLWIKRNRPDAWEKAVYIPEIEDYIVYRLSGVKQTDYSLASRTMAFNVREKCWDTELLDYVGVDVKKLSNPVPTGTLAGEIRAEMADALGLPRNLKIVSISHDQVAACVGAGALASGLCVDGGGTVQCMTPVYQDFPTDPGFAEGKFCVIPYLGKDQYVTYGFTFSGGALLKWFRDQALECQAEGGAFYPRMNGKLPEGPTGLLVLPHFSGAGTPYMDPYATGAILGMKIDTDQGALYKALMEGIAYEMRLNMEVLKKGGVQVDHLMATGGASRSPEWMQIKADITGVPITRQKNEQCGAVGSIMLAGKAIGIYESLEKAARLFVAEGETYRPDPARQAEYDKLYQKYKKAYGAVKEVWA
ncbi:MAG: carbohydrate kinase [Clostridiales bacterium]|nr:carbohydrate kinase [Clostridiales bacterium]